MSELLPLIPRFAVGGILVLAPHRPAAGHRGLEMAAAVTLSEQEYGQACFNDPALFAREAASVIPMSRGVRKVTVPALPADDATLASAARARFAEVAALEEDCEVDLDDDFDMGLELWMHLPTQGWHGDVEEGEWWSARLLRTERSIDPRYEIAVVEVSR